MSRPTKQTVLVVDDEPLNIQMLSQALTPWYRVKAATSGVDALAVAFSDDPPDLILLDIKMPDVDGYTVCSRLKDHSDTRDIPIIFITGKNAAEDETRGLELGAVDYITKPFSLPIVMARIRNQLLLKIKTDMLEELASIDSLTELANRRKFDESLDLEWRRSVRNHTKLSLLMIDIDFFKRVNDNYGHAAGDICLRMIAEALDLCVRRSSDILARYGGEEFAAIIPNLSHTDAFALAEKMREDIAALSIPILSHKLNHKATISVGVATISPTLHSLPAHLLSKADEQLYEAKEAGRNCVKGLEIESPSP